MTYSLKVYPRAKRHIIAAAAWYEERSEGLGKDFVLCVEAALARIKRMPLVYGKVYRDLRRAPVHRFPYTVFFLVNKRKIAVLGVLHQRVDPAKWEALAEE